MVMVACGFPLAAYAGPVEFQNHYYEVIKNPGITWEQANYAAMNSTFMGVNGHLATITSAAEDHFIESLRASKLHSKQAWVGGLQVPSNCSPQPGCGWKWQNEVNIPTSQFPGLLYTNWRPGQPDNNGYAKYLAIGMKGKFGWNDEHDPYKIGGYVIEYDTGIPVADCIEPNSCKPNKGQSLTFPASSVFAPGAMLGVNNFEFYDDQSRCGLDQRVLFDDDAVSDNELIIPAYLCGSPRFLVAAIDGDSVDVPQDTVDIENEVTISLPGNTFECTGPIGGGYGPYPYASDDPQDRDVVAWQTTDPAEMLENDLGGTFGFAGAAKEVTYECGSSRGRVRKGSYFITGMHIDFGPGFEQKTNPAGNQFKFVELTRFKLEVLQKSVIDSQPALSPYDFKALKKLVAGAIKLHDMGKYSDALQKIIKFEQKVNSISYAAIAGENFNGDHLSRSDNIQFMYTDKVIPYTP